jgi:hypothetical protein
MPLFPFDPQATPFTSRHPAINANHPHKPLFKCQSVSTIQEKARRKCWQLKISKENIKKK